MSSDEELMAAYVAGDVHAFDELFGRYSSLLLRIFTRELWRAEDARDLVQQTFLQLHRHRNDYQIDRPFRPWLMTIALNFKRQYYRWHGRRPEGELTEEHTSQLKEAPLGQENHDNRQELQFALAGLPVEQRDVILLHWIGGLPLAEVAEIVNASLSAVKVRAHRGYAAMRLRLERASASPPPQKTEQVESA